MADQRPKAKARSDLKGISGRPEAVRIRLLGGFSVSVGSRTIEEDAWRLRKAAALLKLLALAPAHRLHREQVMEALWPELGVRKASNNLHQVLHAARRALELSVPTSRRSGAVPPYSSGYLLVRDEQLFLCPDGPLWVDVEAFEEAAATARHAAVEPQAFRAAIDLYAGELLPEDRYELWLQERRAQLRELYLSLLTELAVLYEECEDYEPAIEAYGKVVAQEPTREGAHAGIMRLYALSGRRREALSQYERLREALFRELGTEPEAEIMSLQQEILAGTFPHSDPPAPARLAARGRGEIGEGGESRPRVEALRRAPRRMHNLPLARTSFVGREREKLEVKRLVAMTRLLTLTGAGGCGKTRLALEVAADLVGAYPDGVKLVELAPLSDPALVAQAVAEAVGVREQPGRPLIETLEDALRPQKTLLVVDNSEHLVGAVAELVDSLLASCPRLRILATSRETLNIAGEVSWVVPSLTVPRAVPDARSPSTPRELQAYESVRLFVERAGRRTPSFALSVGNAWAVAEICRRLEGIPLAIELAASRMGVLSAQQLAKRLEDSLKVLSRGERTAEPRHRSLRATLEWSHELLSEPERVLFRRLSVFAGGWTLEAAEEVCSGEDFEREDVFEVLSELVERSLVVAEAGEEEVVRFRMLEPIRQYGRERLEESEEYETLRRRHAGYYLKLAERTEPELVGSRPIAALGRLESERGNLRAALSWALDAEEEEFAQRAEMGLRLAVALGRFWDAQGPGEGRRWLEKGLTRSGGAMSTKSVRARALNEAGFIALYEGDPRAMGLLEEALSLYKELGDRAGVAYSMSNLGHAVSHLGQHERMLSLREEAEALLSEPLEKRERAHLLQFLSLAACSEGDLEQMGGRLEEALALFRDLGDVRSIAMCLITLGLIPLSQGDSERAALLFEESLLLQKELNKMAIFFGLAGMAGVATMRGQWARSVKLMGATEALREVLGLSHGPLSIALYDAEGFLAAARSKLSEAAFEAAFSEGQAMFPEEAIEYALSEQEEHGPPTLVAVSEQPPPTDEPTERLTAREQEVALLVGQGLTNRLIASELSISEHTVANHVRKILKKLGLRSRAQLSSS